MYTIDWPATFDSLKDLALGGAAVVTAWVALRGIEKWREELSGKASFEVARALARATYKVRDEIAACRSPLIRSSEYPERSGGDHFATDKNFGRRNRSQAHASAAATDNELSNEIGTAVSAIEARLTGHLRRPSA